MQRSSQKELAVLFLPLEEAGILRVSVKKRTISVCDSILVFGREIAQQSQIAATVSLLLRWQPSKFGSTSLNVGAVGF